MFPNDFTRTKLILLEYYKIKIKLIFFIVNVIMNI